MAAHPRTEPGELDRSVRRVFQDVRIAVDDQLGALDTLPPGRGLPGLQHCRNVRRVTAAADVGLGGGFLVGYHPECRTTATNCDRVFVPMIEPHHPHPPFKG